MKQDLSSFQMPLILPPLRGGTGRGLLGRGCCSGFFLLLLSYSLSAQEPSTIETTWEDQLQQEDLNTEDDALWIQAELYRKHPLNINKAGASELDALPLLNPLLIQQLLLYRELMGDLLHLYELQAVPGWSPELIRQISHFITVREEWIQQRKREDWLQAGEHSVLFRYSRKMGSQNAAEKLKSNDRVFLRYRYFFQNKLQYGVVADKDAGEPFFGPVQKLGFDFYSLHFFIRKQGLLRNIALGDFTVNMGQGLIHWQRLAFGKSADPGSLKRQAPVLHPYQSAGEYNFHRGMAVALVKGHWQLYSFVSNRKLSATIAKDSAGNNLSFSAIRTSGLHQTAGEQEAKNKLRQWAAGTVMRYQNGRATISLNTIYHRFSLPIQKQERPYNLFAIRGHEWFNSSIDYSYTWKNLHLFGEWAIDKQKAIASVTGLMVSLSDQLDLALHGRILSVRYQTVAGQAFTEASTPGNERGFFMSMDWRPFAGARLQAFADHYLFPWIRSNTSAPRRGGEYLLQFTHRPNKTWDYSIRLRQSFVQSENSGFSRDAGDWGDLSRGIRFHIRIVMNGNMEWRQRVEWKQIIPLTGSPSNGYIYYIEGIYKPMMKPWSASIRLQYYDTDGYSSRVYAYERDVLYYSSIPAFYGEGFRYYILLSYDLSKQLSLWIRWAQSIPLQPGAVLHTGTGGGSAAQTEFRVQIKWVI